MRTDITFVPGHSHSHLLGFRVVADALREVHDRHVALFLHGGIVAVVASPKVAPPPPALLVITLLVIALSFGLLFVSLALELPQFVWRSRQRHVHAFGALLDGFLLLHGTNT